MVCLWCFDLRKALLCNFVNPESNLSVRSPELAQGRWVDFCSHLLEVGEWCCVERDPEAAPDVVGNEDHEESVVAHEPLTCQLRFS